MTIYNVTNHAQYGEKVTRRGSTARAGGTKRRGQQGSSMGFFLAGIGILLLIVSAGFLYISQVTSSAVGGYDATSLEKQMNILKDQKRNLELEAADLQSLKTISENIKKMNLVPVEKTVFTSPVISGTVAYSGFGGGS